MGREQDDTFEKDPLHGVNLVGHRKRAIFYVGFSGFTLANGDRIHSGDRVVFLFGPYDRGLVSNGRVRSRSRTFKQIVRRALEENGAALGTQMAGDAGAELC